MTAVAAARDAIDAATDSLRAAGCETPKLDAELLVAAAIGLDRLELVASPDAGLGPAASRTLMGWVRRRARREPVAYILGSKPFRRIELQVDSRVLIPRPETELLVEVAVELAPPGGRVHDVGTGSGAVALAIKDERPDLAVSASDRAPAAVDVTRRNAERLGLEVEVGIETGLPTGGHDLVVANLPYVRDDEWDALAPEISGYEPRDALLGGEDGLDEIRALVADAPAGTLLALEHAPAQAAAVRGLLTGAETRQDLSGRERVTVGRVA
ncbi:MAG: release factor glutamine methyltransferase [Thermoleophilaceae bacterium]|jgi:release factor glutamine methyltransferase|nr:release factor glutamine methyltransferase [Thermoleophilaceae bacterium]